MDEMPVKIWRERRENLPHCLSQPDRLTVRTLISEKLHSIGFLHEDCCLNYPSGV